MKKLAIGLAVCMVMSILLGGVAFAGKGGGAGAGKAFFYNRPSSWNCTEGAIDTDDGPYGFVILNTNAKGDLIVQVALKGATPNAAYDIWVNQYPDGCPLVEPTAPGALTTGDEGNGNAHVKIERVPSATNFWVSAVEQPAGPETQVLRSTAVTLD